ncbi:inward rectifier potassium channel 2 [Leptinotarsa decemlineata]|uniref:inward rectifier potassium channel 2 n=1 Tax=Leptinotarsa decemlineata TaxID=7539 RepID=UPI003D308B41
MKPESMNRYTDIRNRIGSESDNSNDSKLRIETEGTSNDEVVCKPNEKSFTSGNPRLRAILKNGECNIHPLKISKKLFLRDIFLTLVDMKWRWTITIFSLGFFGSWAVFAIGWWLIALMHGDLEENHLPMNQAASNWTPCVTDIYDFTSCFLFSVETQHTTGYGEKRPTEKCPDAVLLMCLQNIVGLIIEAFLVGIVFAKMTRPKLRTRTILFSKHALISMRDNVLCLVIRIADVRQKSRLISPRVKAQLIRERRTGEGEYFSNYSTKLKVSVDDCGGDLFFIWPVSLVHKIDRNSPLYNMSSSDLMREKFEIVVTLEATIESTDQKTQARSSYLPREIMWGRRFESVVIPDEARSGYKIDFSKFDSTVGMDMPTCSAARLEQSNIFERV